MTENTVTLPSEKRIRTCGRKQKITIPEVEARTCARPRTIAGRRAGTMRKPHFLDKGYYAFQKLSLNK